MSTHKLSNRLWKGNQASKEQMLSTTVSGVKTVAEIVNRITNVVDIGPPGLHTGLTGLIYVLDAIQKTSKNMSNVEDLLKKIQQLVDMLENSKTEGTLSVSITDRISQFSKSLDVHIQELEKIASRSIVKRLVHHSEDATAISDHIQAITWSIQSLMVESQVSIEFALDEHGQFMKTAVTEIKTEISNVATKIDKGNAQIEYKLDVRDGHPPHTFAVQFDCGNRVSCLTGTRVDIINEIKEWADRRVVISIKSSTSDIRRENSSTDSRIFWINGSAGTGKTTVAYTMADYWHKMGILGASYFCSRDDAACSNPKLIFPSVAYQLGQFNSRFREEVSQVVKSNPEIGYSSLSNQLERLIVNPLKILGESFPSCMVVIDALDECKDNDTTSEILDVLASHVKELSQIYFLLTSRPEKEITFQFKSSTLQKKTREFVLHEVPLDIVQDDIESYMTAKLSETRKKYNLKESWPSKIDVQTLSRLSSGLFIFAATCIKFIEDRNTDDPRGQLSQLLGSTYVNDRSSPHHRLDELYTQVLETAYPSLSSKLAGRLKMVLGSIIHLQDSLSAGNLENLLGVDSDHINVRTTLMRLQSVVVVPKKDGHVIRLLHPSFFNFLTDGSRCRNPKLVLNPRVQHTLLARSCLRVLCNNLKRNMIGLPNPTTLNTEIEKLPDRIRQSIPPFVQYACRHWSWHLANANLSEGLLDLLKAFVSTRLLYWVEVCSLLGELRSAILALNTTQKALVIAGQDVSDIMKMLNDGSRFVLEYFPILSTSSQQVYSSTLLFAPSDTLIRTNYSPELPRVTIQLGNYQRRSWDMELQTLQGHSSSITSVAFSPNQNIIASGSYDKTIRLWDAVSGAYLKTLEGHLEPVQSVVFSPDGTYIASGSDDKTIRLWNAVSGTHLKTLQGHSKSVQSVVFSHDGTRIASGAYDRTIRLWDAVSGAYLKTLKGHLKQVQSVVFSPNDAYIASGSHDETIRLWDAVSGTHLKTFKGHSKSVQSVVFSPDGTRIASGSSDQTIRLWDVVRGAHLKTLKGSLWSVQSVVFSPDGTRIASGCNDHTIRLGGVVNGAPMKTLKGHSDSVQSVVFSPDGTRIASGSYDGTIRLWGADSSAHLKTIGDYSNRVISVVFSPDGTSIASVFYDFTIRLWDPVSSAHLKTLKGHLDLVQSVVFSPNGARIASGSRDHTIRLWDAASGAHIKSLKGHSSWVHSVVFSPGSSLIASGSNDKTIRLWDAVRGAHLKTLEGYSGTVQSVVFSPDGTRIASGSDDNTIRLWNAVSGAHLKTLEWHSHKIQSVVFSPDGTRIASGSDDKTIRLWNAVSGDCIDTRSNNSSYVSTAHFSLNDDGRARTWGAVSDPQRNLQYFLEEGWIYLLNPRRRLCWIPIEYRNDFVSWGNRIALRSDKRGPLILTLELEDVILAS